MLTFYSPEHLPISSMKRNHIDLIFPSDFHFKKARKMKLDHNYAKKGLSKPVLINKNTFRIKVIGTIDTSNSYYYKLKDGGNSNCYIKVWQYNYLVQKLLKFFSSKMHHSNKLHKESLFICQKVNFNSVVQLDSRVAYNKLMYKCLGKSIKIQLNLLFLLHLLEM
jgi:hypothetical protein